MKQFSKIFFAFLIVGALAFTAAAQGAKKSANPASKAKAAPKAVKFMGKGDGITTCPVTGEEISSKDQHADLYGRTVYFCCGGCLAKAQKNPAMYIKKTEEAQKAAVAGMAKSEGHGHAAAAHDHAAMSHDGNQAAAQDKTVATKYIGKGDGVETCPVTGEPVDKKLTGEADGQKFAVCCAGCLETVKANPAAYLKAKK